MSTEPFDKIFEAAVADLNNLPEAEFNAKWEDYKDRHRARTTRTLREFANSDVLEA